MQTLPCLHHDAALFLDFDGTLVELAPTPEAVVVPGQLIALLGRLRHWLDGAVAIVTGRQIDVLDRFLTPLRLPACGEHGAQRRDATGRFYEQAAPELGRVLEVANALAANHPGLLIERKHAAIALHCRQVPEHEALCRVVLQDAIADNPQLELQCGKRVVEVKPAGIDKGTGIETFLREHPFSGRTPVFVGDDATDESGFRVVQRHGGMAVKVGAGPSLAHHRLDSPRTVLGWLARACPALRQQTSRRSPA